MKKKNTIRLLMSRRLLKTLKCVVDIDNLYMLGQLHSGAQNTQKQIFVHDK